MILSRLTGLFGSSTATLHVQPLFRHPAQRHLFECHRSGMAAHDLAYTYNLNQRERVRFQGDALL
ncbi:hypothetical protein BRPE64_ECDS03180 (plasmid) [Caballeronia insecticola]|uniref:Uncharacterized protein n=1 Tax=Caballeronia insecticola TaxID=758793 RepID=A0A060PRY3_9BURK|nr:hypothetical protein BRPE64_ECDS03180 [Caballeronia insecticola]